MRFNLFNTKLVEMVQYEITPDRSIHNKKAHELFRGLSTFYTSPLDNMRGKTAGAFWWDVLMLHDSVRFFATFPADWKREIVALLANTWEGCSIESIFSPVLPTLMPMSSDVCEMKYRRSNMFALKVDNRTEIEPLNSMLSVTADLEQGDIARYSICAEPTSRLDWQDHAERLHKQFRDGKTPRRRRITKKDVFVSIGEMITNTLQSLLEGVHGVMGDEEVKKSKVDDYEKRVLMLDGLSRGTVNKSRMPVFNTHIRIASHSEDLTRQRIIMRTVANSFNDLTAENELERHDYHDKIRPHVIRELNSYKLGWLTRLDMDKNKMSNEELGRLAEMPTAALQEKYDQINSMDTRQVDVPALLLRGGLLLGTVEYKRNSKEVFFPVNDHDQLCLPTVVIGGMGSGKTKGFGCNRAIGFVESGYSSIIFDPAKSEVWEIIEKALPKEKRKRILLGEDVISLDFREAMRTAAGRGRLAQIILAFFQDNTDTAGAQTQRFIRAAVMGMRTGKLREIMQLFNDKNYRDKAIEAMPDGMHKDSLKEFGGYSGDRQRQILAPILNRLDVILGDPYLERCMNADAGIDMVEVLSKRGVCTVFDVPDRLNTRAAKDIMINLISFKIDAAMSLRKDHAEFPVAIIYDEPHQYLRSASLWENVAVESRKYRLAYTWLFHSWEQIPDKLAQIIKDAGPHYFIYPSSKKTYSGLREELAPFTVEDGLNTRRYHAICALKFGYSRLTPFMAHMAAPIENS